MYTRRATTKEIVRELMQYGMFFNGVLNGRINKAKIRLHVQGKTITIINLDVKKTCPKAHITIVAMFKPWKIRTYFFSLKSYVVFWKRSI